MSGGWKNMHNKYCGCPLNEHLIIHHIWSLIGNLVTHQASYHLLRMSSHWVSRWVGKYAQWVPRMSSQQVSYYPPCISSHRASRYPPGILSLINVHVFSPGIPVGGKIYTMGTTDVYSTNISLSTMHILSLGILLTTRHFITYYACLLTRHLILPNIAFH